MEETNKIQYEEKSVKSGNGAIALLITLITAAIFIAGAVFSFISNVTVLGVILAIGGFIIFIIGMSGLHIIKPNEGMVLMFFGKYAGTLKKEGLYFINPLYSEFRPSASTTTQEKVKDVNGKETNVAKPNSTKISLKAITLNNQKQKVNDLDGNPVEIGVIVIWKIKDTAKAVFNVDNFIDFVSIQSDATIRNIARQYPYDINTQDSNISDEKSLRGSSQEIADMLREELQSRVDIAGIEITEARIAHLAYSPEIAAAMLQRQQAKAIVDARSTIVEGAVGMVEMALAKLSETGIVELDEERKAQMVTNLMVVLCSNKDAQPIVNSGSIY